MNYKRNFSILFVAFCIWASTDLNYSAKGHEDDRRRSIELMMKWSPFSQFMLIEDFEIASDDSRGTNLDGLNVAQIHEIAIKRRDIVYRKQIEIMKQTLLNNVGEAVVLKLHPTDYGELLPRKELEMRINNMEDALIENQRDADSFHSTARFRRMIAFLFGAYESRRGSR